jgi:hypothetical protein
VDILWWRKTWLKLLRGWQSKAPAFENTGASSVGNGVSQKSAFCKPSGGGTSYSRSILLARLARASAADELLQPIIER